MICLVARKRRRKSRNKGLLNATFPETERGRRRKRDNLVGS
jgi:hypothetical protein